MVYGELGLRQLPVRARSCHSLADVCFSSLNYTPVSRISLSYTSVSTEIILDASV